MEKRPISMDMMYQLNSSPSQTNDTWGSYERKEQQQQQQKTNKIYPNLGF